MKAQLIEYQIILKDGWNLLLSKFADICQMVLGIIYTSHVTNSRHVVWEA